MNLDEKLTSVASALADGWVYHAADRELRNGTKCVYVRSVFDKLHFRGVFPSIRGWVPGMSRTTTDSVGISGEKAPEIVARELRRRLLAGYEQDFATVSERIAAVRAVESAHLLVLDEIAKAIGQRQAWTIDTDTDPRQVVKGGSYLDRQHAELEVNTASGYEGEPFTFTVTLKRLTLSDTLDIIALLKERGRLVPFNPDDD